MDSRDRVEALVAPLRADVVSGAVSVTRAAAEILRRAAIRAPAATLEELRWELGQVATGVLDAQAAMASLTSLVRSIVDALEGADTLAEARHAAATAAERFKVEMEERSAGVAAQASAIVPERGSVATISSSSTVRRTLSEAGRGEGLRVVCFESRPMQEGRTLAADLARTGLAVTFAVDAAAYSLLPSCDVALLGADSVGDLGIVNKIGSTALARAAAVAGVPTYVLADESKLLPVGFPQRVDDDRPGPEVWDAPPGVLVWNRYFEVIPWTEVAGVVTEAGVFTREELLERRRSIEFPELLRRWAGVR